VRNALAKLTLRQLYNKYIFIHQNSSNYNIQLNDTRKHALRKQKKQQLNQTTDNI